MPEEAFDVPAAVPDHHEEKDVLRSMESVRAAAAEYPGSVETALTMDCDDRMTPGTVRETVKLPDELFYDYNDRHP